METKKITEKMLLDGYDGCCNDGITAISKIKNEEIRWTYRTQSGCATEDRSEAVEIELSYDRTGIISINDDNIEHLAIAAHSDNCQAIWGDIV